jgi:hypothetical protein
MLDLPSLELDTNQFAILAPSLLLATAVAFSISPMWAEHEDYQHFLL